MTDGIGLDLFRKMYLIRSAETAIKAFYFEDEMKTPMHMSMGEEAVVAGVCHALRPEDQVVGSYRSHALYLAKAMETDRFFAEMYGKVDGCARGKAGSMHLASPKHGMMGSCAIVGGFIPVALGLAFANKYKRNGRMVAVFHGDGAADEGAFWESLNAACLYKLPVMFICEDNRLAVHTTAAERRGFGTLTDVIRQFDCDVYADDTTDVEQVHAIAHEALTRCQEHKRPAFVHLHYYRYLEHVGVSEDFDAGYRSRDEFLAWKARDPVDFQRKRLIDAGIEDRVVQVEGEIDIMVQESVTRAKEATFSSVSETYEGVFQCG